MYSIMPFMTTSGAEFGSKRTAIVPRVAIE